MNAPAHPTLFRSLPGLALAMLAAGCVSPTALDNLPCPCASGWTCCTDQNVCVREGASCPDPGSLKVRFGGTLQLNAEEPVTWSLEEGALGGQITDDGRYTAPLRPGPFHAIATSLTHPDRRTRYEIAVGPTHLEVLAGRIGGTGQLDGIGEETRFGEMYGIVGDGAGHLYVSSNYGHRYHPASGDTRESWNLLGAVRRIDLATSVVSTVATIELKSGSSYGFGKLAIDPAGKLYSTTNAQEVVRIDPASGAVTILLPSSSPDVYMLENALIGLLGDSLYFHRVGSLGNGKGSAEDIARLDLSTGKVASVAGSLTEGGQRDGIGADARIHWLQGAVIDANGAILFADYPPDARFGTSCFLRRLDPTTRAVTTVTEIEACPRGLAIDKRGLLYTAKGNSNAATVGGKEQIGISQVLKKTYPLLVSLPWPVDGLTHFETQYSSQLYIEGDTIYAADNPHRLIRKIGPITTYNASGGELIATVQNVDTLIAGAQAWIGNSDGQGPGARFDRPGDMSVDAQGNVHVSDRSRTRYGQARMISANGSVRTRGEIRADVGLASSPGGRLFSVQSSDKLIELTALGSMQLPVIVREGGINAFYLPKAMAADDRAVYVLDEGHTEMSMRIRRYDLATHEVRTLALHDYSPDEWIPLLTTDGAGNVLAASRTKVYRIHGVTGAMTEINLGGAIFNSITAVARDPMGIYYVADEQHIRAIVESTGEGFDLVGRHGMLSAAGVRTGALPAAVNGVSGLAVLPDGTLAVSTSAENAVLIAR